MSNSVLKQIACIAAYSAGISVGMYASMKAVDAIEKKWPMKKKSMSVRVVGRVSALATVRLAHDTSLNVTKAVVTEPDGSTRVYEGGDEEVRQWLDRIGAPVNPLAKKTKKTA